MPQHGEPSSRRADRRSSAIPHFETLPEVANRRRSLTADCGASHFAIFLLGKGAEPRRLLPSLDSDYPGRADRTAQLVETLGERVARRAAESTRPFWWSDSDLTRAALSLSRCIWAERIAPPHLADPALALPLAAERDDDGLIVFSGDGLAVSSSTLADLHARCMALFGLVAKLRPTAAEALPSVSRRELQCLKLSANGHTSGEIAGRLGLSVHTANQYLTQTAQKLNAANRVHAVAKALRLGLID